MFDFLKNSSNEDLQKELIKQLTFSNWLKLLDSQYKHADSIMSIEEIQSVYQIIYNELQTDIDLSRLENKS